MMGFGNKKIHPLRTQSGWETKVGIERGLRRLPASMPCACQVIEEIVESFFEGDIRDTDGGHSLWCQNRI
jgi:hypothetical protein